MPTQPACDYVYAETQKSVRAQEKGAVASAVRLIDRLGLRVGNERYLKENKTRPGDRAAETRDAIRHAAKEIKNRYTTCRKHYVHPLIIEKYKASSSCGFCRLQIQELTELQKAVSLLLRILEG